MHRIVMGSLALLILGPALWALDDPPDKPKEEPPRSLREQVQGLMQEYNKAQQEYRLAIQAAQAKMPRQDVYAEKFLELARKNPKDPAALDAIAWVVNNTGGTAQTRAVDLLTKNYVEDPKVGSILNRFAYNLTGDAEKFLRAVMEKNPSADTQGVACFVLASAFKNQLRRAQGAQGERMSKEAEELFERVVEKYADVRYGRDTLGVAARAQLTGLRNQRQLAVGKLAPEIEGEDVDGKKFKLSDYRGKVVVLDFWGHW
jgi:hypothetical protein